MIKGFDTLSPNNQLRISEVSIFLLVAKGVENAGELAMTRLMELFLTPKEWRKYRKDLFRKANQVREKMGLSPLGT